MCGKPQWLEYESNAETNIMSRRSCDANWVVIDLDRTDLNAVIETDIDTAAECTCKSGIREGLVADLERSTVAADRGDTAKISDLRSCVADTNQCMCKRLEGPCL